jgi:hypothetical protein
MENIADQYKHIKGWGVDADPTNEPTHPMKKYTGDDHQRINWQRPALQQYNVEILKSNERPTLSAVNGTAVPPSGLSGVLRRYAFKYSESSYGHWLPLLLADRINVVEGIVDDIKSGHFPNILAEKGIAADWKYNRKALIQKTVAFAAVGLVAWAALKSKKK